MRVLTITEPTTTNNSENERVHYFCCSEKLALCGISLENSYLEPEDSDNKICELCDMVLNFIGVDVVCTDRCLYIRL